jgi:hypothetical protein
MKYRYLPVYDRYCDKGGLSSDEWPDVSYYARKNRTWYRNVDSSCGKMLS